MITGEMHGSKNIKVLRLCIYGTVNQKHLGNWTCFIVVGIDGKRLFNLFN